MDWRKAMALHQREVVGNGQAVCSRSGNAWPCHTAEVAQIFRLLCEVKEAAAPFADWDDDTDATVDNMYRRVENAIKAVDRYLASERRPSTAKASR